MTSGCENAGLSLKRRRIYCRTFNYAECRDLRAQGWTQKALAKKYGVSPTTIRRVTDPEFRRAFDAKSSAYVMGGVCSDCGKEGVSRYAGGRCKPCASALRATSARDGELLCFKCREWKPDALFPGNRENQGKARRGRASFCRECQTKARQEYRERHKVPCDRCGKPRLPGKEKTGNHRVARDTGLCLDCYRESMRAA